MWPVAGFVVGDAKRLGNRLKIHPFFEDHGKAALWGKGKKLSYSDHSNALPNITVALINIVDRSVILAFLLNFI